MADLKGQQAATEPEATKPVTVVEPQRITRKTHSFDERMMHMMRIWYPNRSEESIRDTVNGLYNYEQSFPDEDGNVPPHIENRLTKLLIDYRSLDNEHDD